MAIYFFEGESRMIKIGRSRDVDQRKEHLQREYKETMRVLGIMRAPNPMEKELHARFKHLSRGNEWFTPAEDLYQFILENGVNGLADANERKSVTKLIGERLFDLESPHRNFIHIINDLREQLEQERVQKRIAEEKLERLKNENPGILRRLQEIRDLRAMVINLKRESARLIKANDFLIARNMHLAKHNNQLRDQVAFLNHPTPSAAIEEAAS
jgi:hypothetical protein